MSLWTCQEKKRKDYAFWRQFNEKLSNNGLPRATCQHALSSCKEGATSTVNGKDPGTLQPGAVGAL